MSAVATQFSLPLICVLFLIPQLSGEDYLADASDLYQFVCGGGEDGLCSILVERILYEAPDVSSNFFVKFRVVNMSDRELWIDLRDYWSLMRPVQYTSSDELYLNVINIRTPVVPEVTEEFTNGVIEALAGGVFTPLPARSSLDIYVDFNAAGKHDIEALEEQYLFIGYGGWFTVTDGMTVQVVYPEGNFTFLRSELPVLWDEVPRGSIIAYDHALDVTVEKY